MTLLFVGQTAWFSSSVGTKERKLWKTHGGIETGAESARFIFSQDAECRDVKMLYESEAYLDQHLAIFHASYIIDCVKRCHPNEVVLGEYFLPPNGIQQAILKHVDLKWAHSESSQSSKSSEDSDVEMDTAHEEDRNSGVDLSRAAELFHVDLLLKTSGVLQEFIPGQNGCEVFCL